MRKLKIYRLDNPGSFREKLFVWLSRFGRSACLNSNDTGQQSYYAAGQIDELIPAGDDSFAALKRFHENKKDWLFGYLTYDLKNEIEKLSSDNPDGLKFPKMHFFQPEYVFVIKGNRMEFHYPESCPETAAAKIFHQISNAAPSPSHLPFQVSLCHRMTKDQYLKAVSELKHHIRIGDIYEINFCQEFYAENVQINPFDLYRKLNEISPTPFSCFLRTGDRYLLSASPERFLKKTGKKIISQPIKGTIRRGTDAVEDNLLKRELYNNIKDRSENVMIVDLVRNDLSKTARQGTVKVDELFGIYTFPQVHQMISTVSAEMRDDLHFTDVIKNAFPMGSMTGAPKISAMKLIDEYERTKRGLFSGAAGYITPEGDFDLNVVIRSLLYHETAGYLSVMAGGAITDRSDPAQEYDECLLKARAIFETVGYRIPEMTIA